MEGVDIYTESRGFIAFPDTPVAEAWLHLEHPGVIMHSSVYFGQAFSNDEVYKNWQGSEPAFREL